MKEILKKIDFITIILLIIFVIVSYCYAQLKILNYDYINFCGYTIFQVITGSMEDTIKIKDIVIVKLADEVQENDIITYRYKEDFVTHRVVEINDSEEIITKGDANTSKDDPISKKDIVGKVVFIISNVAVWIEVLKTPQVIIAILVTIIAIWFLFKKPKENK